MSFLVPEFLWLALLVAVVAILILFQQAKDLKSVFSKEVYEKLKENDSGLSSSWRIVLLVLAMFMMIFALARPVSDEQIIKINETAIDIIAALDISRSMEAEDLYPNRLLWGKKKLLDLIKKGDDFRLGVMAFAANAYVVSPITSDEEVAHYLVENLDSTSISEKGTDILQVVDAASKQLKDRIHKYLLLITDGGDDEAYDEAIERAKEEGIVVFVLATATEKGAPIKEAEGGFVKKEGQIILTRLNEKIKTIALQTGGAYIQSSASSADIDALIKEIKSIATNETIDSSEIKKYDELFIYFLAAALVILLFAFASVPKKQIAALFVLFFAFIPLETKAGLLDFITLDQAQEAYEAQDYNESTQRYQSLLDDEKRDALNYNLANSLYKQKRFEEAISGYEAISKTSELRQKSLHNLGNSYAFSKKFDKAKEAYEAALALGEDQQTRENLEEILRHMKKDDQNKQPDKKDGQDKQSDENKPQDKDEDPKEKKDGNKKGQSKQEQKQQQSAKEQEAAKEAAKDHKKEQEKQAQSKQKPDQEAPKESEKVEQTAQASQKDITDKEEYKLLDRLDQQKGQTYRYHIPSEYKKDQHDKPW